MPVEVSYNQALKGENYYGFGIIQATPMDNLDAQGDMIMDNRGGNPCLKEEIRTDQKLKVDKNKGKNYYSDYLNEPISKLNFDERQEYNMDEGVRMVNEAENQNLDFDEDGVMDYKIPTTIVNNKKAEEVKEQLEEPPEALPDKAEPVIKESHLQDPVNPETAKVFGGEQAETKTYEKAQNELESVTANISDNKIRTSEMIQMGAGAMALAMLVMSRATV